MKQLNIIENVSIALGISLSLTQIQTIMGIVLLAFQLLLIVTKIVLKVIDHIKKGNIEEAVKDIEDGQKEIEDATKKK